MSAKKLVLCLLAAAWSLASCGTAPLHAAAGTAAEAGDHGGHGHEDLGHGNATKGLNDPSQFRTDLAIYTFAVFLVLLAILSKAAWPKISEALVEREKRIESALADADAKHEQAKALLAQHEAKLATAADQVRALLEEARRDAEATRDAILAEARDGAAKERQRAVRDIELAADSAMKGLAETSASLAVQLASKVLGEQVQASPAKQAELVRSALSQLTSSSPSQN